MSKCYLKLITYLSVALLLIGMALAPSTDAQSRKTDFTDQDKVEIIKLILEDVRAPNSFLNPAPGYLYITLSNQNLTKDWLRKIGGAGREVLAPDEIQKKANKDGSFEYLAFTGFRIEGDRLIVGVMRQWSRGEKDELVRGGRRGITVEVRKSGGRFSREIISWTESK
jgi:hypothetical protein